MNQKVQAFLRLAASVAASRQDNRSYLVGAVAIRDDGAIVSSRNEATHEPNPCAHAEARLLKKAGSNATFFVARVLRGDRKTLAYAKPCASCTVLLRGRKPKKVFYTTGPNTWEVL